MVLAVTIFFPNKNETTKKKTKTEKQKKAFVQMSVWLNYPRLKNTQTKKFFANQFSKEEEFKLWNFFFLQLQWWVYGNGQAGQKPQTQLLQREQLSL